VFRDQGSQWIAEQQAAAAKANPKDGIEHNWQSCSCLGHNWHCDQKGKPMFFACNILVSMNTPLNGQMWAHQRCIDFHGLMLMNILDRLSYTGARGEQRIYRKSDFFVDMKAQRAYAVVRPPRR
jgi:hypothetical protein